MATAASKVNFGDIPDFAQTFGIIEAKVAELHRGQKVELSYREN